MESGFKTSDYPIVLSLENHCSEAQQNEVAADLRPGEKRSLQMSRHFVEVFRDHLQDRPLADFPLVKGQQLPSPNDLKFKILLKGLNRRCLACSSLRLGAKTKKLAKPFYAKIRSNLQRLKAERDHAPRLRPTATTSAMSASAADVEEMADKRRSAVTITSEMMSDNATLRYAKRRSIPSVRKKTTLSNKK